MIPHNKIRTNTLNYTFNPKYISFCRETKEDIGSESYESNDHASWPGKASTSRALRTLLPQSKPPKPARIQGDQIWKTRSEQSTEGWLPCCFSYHSSPNHSHEPKGKLRHTTNEWSILGCITCRKLGSIVIIYFLVHKSGQTEQYERRQKAQ